MIWRVLLVAMLLLPLTARAEDIVAYEAEGEAAAASADPRVAALDDAFARAVASALADLVAGDARTAHKGELDREIVGHARLWVKAFTVTRDETNDDRRQLVVSVRIDRDKLRARLAELSIATLATGPATPSDTRSVVILLRAATPHGVHADYGDGGEKDVSGVAALTNALRNAGYAVRVAPTSGAAARGDGDLPLSDDEAEALATQAGAQLALIAGVSVGAGVPARGQPKDVALVTAHVRLVDVAQKKALGQGSAIAAGLGEEGLGYAVDRALSGALGDVLPPAPKKLAQAGSYQGDDTPVTEPGIVLVRLPSTTSWRLVLEEQKYLAGARGVHAATLRRLSPRGWVIGVATGEPIERVAQIAKRAPTADSTAAVKIVGDLVELSLSGATP